MTVQYQLRRIAVFAVIAALLIGAFSVMAVAMPSDVNGDGELSTADARVLLLSLTGAVTLTEEQRSAADANGDGEITSSDARAMLVTVLTPVTTAPTATIPTVMTTTNPPTTTTTTTTVAPTTMPYASFTVTADTVRAQAGETFTLPVKISFDHALVAFEMDICYDPSLLTLVTVNEDAHNPYATSLHTNIFNDRAAWRFTKLENGVLNVRYVSSATSGSLSNGVLFRLTFLPNSNVGFSTSVRPIMRSHLCRFAEMDYVPYAKTVDGTIVVDGRTTDSTQTPTITSQTTTWVLTGPDGTAPTTMPTTTTAPLIDCISTPAPTYPTTLPYGDPLCFTGETVTARVGDTFTWTISVSQRHSLVGLRLNVYYDPSVLEFIPDGTAYNSAVFNDQSQWRLVPIASGTLSLHYVSKADTGEYNGGELITLTFRLRNDVDVSIDESYIRLEAPSYLSAVNKFAYMPTRGTITDGHIKVASRTTRPKTTTTTSDDSTTTYPTTTTTFVYDQ
ncbi:MAG: hypothetical protein IKV35_04390 [Clostridia bacterium]|nr:hypothetical protein [Clostridia bacterium]